MIEPQRIVTSSAGETVYFSINGERVWSCRCGVTHTGPYAANDWLHHNCLHDAGLTQLSPGYLMCRECGKTFHVWIDR